MSDRMRPIPFSVLLEGVLTEYAATGTLFGVPPGFRANPAKTLSLFGETMETPFGPAAGPHTQLTQNCIAAYLGGARFFELKTVQTLDGEDLPVSKPCILAEDEGYNVEWSTELTVPQALDEYIKAWFALKILSRELELGGENGFVFNMSVGYDLAGISSPKIDAFLEGLKDASHTPIWQECRAAAQALLPRLHRVDAAYLDRISPKVCSSVTLSTLHGCPPDEIERIATYLLEEKGLHTFVKCNPTLLGYDFCRKTLDDMGYDYLVFDDHHFTADLQFADAVPMLTRLMARGEARGLLFGVKLTNTFPVTIAQNELPGEEMYLSGKALYPLTLALAEKLTAAFGGKLRISYSGGADGFNIGDIFSCGIWPITLATTLLKPGGYQRLPQLAKALAGATYGRFSGVDLAKVSALALRARTDPHHLKPQKPPLSRKLEEKVPLLDCFTAPCKGGCPIGQDIPEYLRLVGEGEYAQALRVILKKNPLPHITGTLCAHRCTTKCTRNFYETPIRIRQAKLLAAQGGWAEVLPQVRPLCHCPDLKIAVVGGGPAGMASAFFLARGGATVTLFEGRNALGGVVRHVIPAFRIGTEAIEADAALLTQLGVEIRLNTEAPTAEELLALGYTHVVLAVGAWEPGRFSVAGILPVNALDFLEACRTCPTLVRARKSIIVVGGGNTAMDAARAAKRLPGVEHVTLVYRRTRRYMPADEEELALTLAEGVAFRELLAPVSWVDGNLTCSVLRLGAPDSSGRRAPVETGETIALAADLVIGAVGEGVDGQFLTENGVAMDHKHLPVVHSSTLESSKRNVFVAGDARRGPATIVEAIADAATISQAILGQRDERPPLLGRMGDAALKKGILAEPTETAQEANRCLECNTLCECCVDVCPNRANVAVQMLTRKMPQIVHIDGMCNECGNCATFCPYDSAPYRDKFTVFGTVADFRRSHNNGFVLLDCAEKLVRVRLDGLTVDTTLRDEHSPIPSDIHELMETICTNYSYLLYDNP